MRCPFPSLFLFTLPLGLVLCLIQTATLGFAGESYELNEPPSDNRPFRVKTNLKVDGKIMTAQKEGKALSLELKGSGKHTYLERRLPSRGRDALSFRSVREYQSAGSEIKVREQQSSSRLRETRRRLIAQGERRGIEIFSLDGPLSFNETELLGLPGDSLAMLGLLPSTEVEVGEEWDPDTWVLQMLVGVEAVLKSELTCKLDSVENQLAKITLSGELEGAHLGTSVEITIRGIFEYSLAEKHITRWVLSQKDKRSIGAVSPGLDVKAEVTGIRTLLKSPEPLTDVIIERIPLDPEESYKKLMYQTPWKATILHDRNWWVYKQTENVAVVRLMEKGSLIAQFNLSGINAVEAGTHTSLAQFEADIKKALGERVEQLEKAERIPTDDGRFLFRVRVTGKTKDLEMTWLYYLCAGPKGDQVAFVFSVESKLYETLKERDKELVKSISFEKGKSPTKAVP